MALCSALLLGAPGHAEVFRDNFDDNHIDPTVWVTDVWGSGPQIAEANQQLEISMPGSSSGQEIGCKLASVFLLRGNFDVQVDFRLLTWPVGNGVRMGMGIDEVGFPSHAGVERTSFGQSDYPGWPREVYCVDFPDGVHGITGTEDFTGTLRLVRSGNSQTGYYRSGDTWVVIGTGSAPTGDVRIKVAAWSAYQFMHWDVFASWDNLVINTGTIVRPPPATGACCFPAGVCLQGTQLACQMAGGHYVGDGLSCEPDPCVVVAVEPSTWGRVKASYR
ncbi:MAG: hypothetical protein U0167_03120 [bacterium]